MESSSPFQSLAELAASLGRSVDALTRGDLSREALEQLTEQSRELYERLIVLRHLAYERSVHGESATPEAMNMKESRESTIVFRVNEEQADPVVPMQVSLIDAIEEMTRSEEPQSAPPAFVQPQPGVPAPAESLNERLSRTLPAQETLARKLEVTPISDLKRAISLNQRFQFSKELFRGNNQDYEVTIDRLNTSSRDEAMKTLEVLRTKYGWNQDSPVTQDFVDLVDRRHQA